MFVLALRAYEAERKRAEALAEIDNAKVKYNISLLGVFCLVTLEQLQDDVLFERLARIPNAPYIDYGTNRGPPSRTTNRSCSKRKVAIGTKKCDKVLFLFVCFWVRLLFVLYSTQVSI